MMKCIQVGIIAERNLKKKTQPPPLPAKLSTKQKHIENSRDVSKCLRKQPVLRLFGEHLKCGMFLSFIC